jgi:hypothetical protein
MIETAAAAGSAGGVAMHRHDACSRCDALLPSTCDACRAHALAVVARVCRADPRAVLDLIDRVFWRANFIDLVAAVRQHEPTRLLVNFAVNVCRGRDATDEQRRRPTSRRDATMPAALDRLRERLADLGEEMGNCCCYPPPTADPEQLAALDGGLLMLAMTIAAAHAALADVHQLLASEEAPKAPETPPEAPENSRTLPDDDDDIPY